MIKNIFLFLFIILQSIAHCQSSIDNMKAIDNDVWLKFEKAFATFDNSLMREIHSKKVIRLSSFSQNIRNYEDYMGSNKKSFQRSLNSGSSSNILLRFFERINNDELASERGIYKLISNKGKSNEYNSYGQFHVLLEKEKGNWKIIFDYDSNENKTIGEEQYVNAFARTDYKKFIKQKKGSN